MRPIATKRGLLAQNLTSRPVQYNNERGADRHCEKREKEATLGTVAGTSGGRQFATATGECSIRSMLPRSVVSGENSIGFAVCGG